MGEAVTETYGKQAVALYGAQMVAVSVYFALKRLYPHIRVYSFIVSSREGNPASIDGVPVVTLEEFDRRDIRILIATPENHHEAIAGELKKRGFSGYECVDSGKKTALMERYYAETGGFPALKAYPAGKEKASVAVYMSKFHKDRPLTTPGAIPEWVRPIQAGAALTDVRVAELTDDIGENISARNGNYSELTATYWIGKHGEADYLGLYHYRRILEMEEEDLARIAAGGIDVVLPYPSIHYPGIQAHHRRCVEEGDWEAMLRALEELSPSYARALPELFSGAYFYNFNILVAKKEIFRRYCEWMFPILFRTEELSVPRGSTRADRYTGYLGENLTTLFFLYHQRDFKIAHTGCRMLT